MNFQFQSQKACIKILYRSHIIWQKNVWLKFKDLDLTTPILSHTLKVSFPFYLIWKVWTKYLEFHLILILYESAKSYRNKRTYSQSKISVQSSVMFQDSKCAHYDLIFQRIFTYKWILGGHPPKCQHLFYLADIYYHCHVPGTGVFTMGTVVNKKGLGLALMKHVNQWLCLREAELQCDFSFFFFFFNLISEVATCNACVIRESY